MNLYKCEKGHFYDREKYHSCPHCSQHLLIRDLSAFKIPIQETIPPGIPDMRTPEMDFPELPDALSLFRITNVIEKDSSKTVYKIEPKNSYTIKVIPKPPLKSNKYADNEYEIGQELMDGKHFIDYYKKIKASKNVFLVQGDQISWPNYENTYPVTRSFILDILQDILFSIIAMEQKGFMHLDINPDNIFIDSKKKGRLGNFSYSRKIHLDKRHSTICGAPEYTAPEIINRNLCSGKEDMYSFGITLYKMFTKGLSPYAPKDREQKYRAIDDTLFVPHSLPKEIKSIVEKCTAYDPADRYNNLYELLGVFTMTSNELKLSGIDLYIHDMDYNEENNPITTYPLDLDSSFFNINE